MHQNQQALRSCRTRTIPSRRVCARHVLWTSESHASLFVSILPSIHSFISLLLSNTFPKPNESREIEKISRGVEGRGGGGEGEDEAGIGVAVVAGACPLRGERGAELPRPLRRPPPPRPQPRRVRESTSAKEGDRQTTRPPPHQYHPLREIFAHGSLLSPQKGVLLYGPPGTGKTMLAKAIAKESGAVFINVRVSNLMSKWFGDAQKLVAAVFSLAYKLQPAIIFIDEVDSFLGQRRTTDHEAMTNMKTEFMSLWDGFTTDKNARVMVLAATNRPSELDEAILRRFTQSFEIGIPDQNERTKILKIVLKDEKVEEDIDFYYIASLCVGFTGSDILELCKQAAYFPIRELLNDEKNGRTTNRLRPLRQSDLEKALSTSRKGKRSTSRLRSTLQSPTDLDEV